MMDLHNNIKVSRGLSPVAAGTDNTPYVSEIIDTAQFSATEFLILIGANTDADATFTILVEDGNVSTLTDNAAVADAYLLGTEAGQAFNYGDDNETRKIGYIGPKRYVRVTITPANNGAGNIFLAGCWVQGGARVAPQA
jgi:hypothetical protein